jgi:GGDEF domain-containing protein
MAGIQQDVGKAERKLSPEEAVRFGVVGSHELERLRGNIEAARAAAEGNAGDQAAAKRLKIAECQLELFLAEHDNAGAFKFKRFGRETGAMFSVEAVEGPSEAMLAPDGKIEFSERLADRKFLFVNMGELDRFNKEGGHKAGDEVLFNTAKLLEREVLDRLGGQENLPHYELFRYSGNEFMLQIDNASQEDMDAIAEAIAAAKPDAPGVKEGAPLSVTGFGLREAAELFNAAIEGLPKDERPALPGEASREIITIIRQLADYNLEVGKFVTRANRAKEKIESRPQEAEAFFNNYLAKTLKGTGLDSLETVRGLMTAGETEFDDAIRAMAFESARSRIAEDRQFEDIRQHIIDGVVERHRGGRGQGAEWQATESFFADRKLAVIPQSTKGLDILARYKAAAEGQAGMDREERELAGLEWQVETARRDGLTGLLERGSHYEDLEKDIAVGKDTALVFVDMGYLKYFDQKGGRDVGNGAVRLAASILERAIEAAGVKGEAYRYGGDEFTIRLEGGEQAAEKVMLEIGRLREEAGAVPDGPKSKPEYRPMPLVFNAGYCDRGMMEEVYGEMEKADALPDRVRSDDAARDNQKAEIMAKVADAGIEADKAVSRFSQLVFELRSPEYFDDPLRRSQVDSLIDFSSKAVYGELGGVDFLKVLAHDRSVDGVELEQRIRDFVGDKMREARESGASHRELVDRLIETQGRVRWLEGEVRRLEALAAGQGAEIGWLKQKISKLEDERRAIVEGRKAVDEAFGAGGE